MKQIKVKYSDGGGSITNVVDDVADRILDNISNGHHRLVFKDVQDNTIVINLYAACYVQIPAK